MMEDKSTPKTLKSDDNSDYCEAVHNRTFRLAVETGISVLSKFQ